MWMTALVSKHPSGHHVAAEEENDQRTPEEMWTAEYKYSWGKMGRQHRTELKMEKSLLSVTYRPMFHRKRQDSSSAQIGAFLWSKVSAWSIHHWWAMDVARRGRAPYTRRQWRRRRRRRRSWPADWASAGRRWPSTARLVRLKATWPKAGRTDGRWTTIWTDCCLTLSFSTAA